MAMPQRLVFVVGAALGIAAAGVPAAATAGTLGPDGFTMSPAAGMGSLSLGITTSGYGPQRTVAAHQSKGEPIALSGYRVAGEEPGPGTCTSNEPGQVECGLVPQGGEPFHVRGTDGDDSVAELGCDSPREGPERPCERVFKVALGAGRDLVRIWTFSDLLSDTPDPITGQRPWVAGLRAPMDGIEIDGGPGNDELIHMGGPRNGRIDAGDGDDRIFTAGGYSESREPSTGTYLIRCGPGRDLVQPAPTDRVAADCERIFYAGHSDEEEQGGADAGIVCGEARFRFYPVSGASSGAFVKPGEQACVLALSNRASRELSDRAGTLTAAIISTFSERLAEHLAGETRETASQQNLERTGKKLLKKLLPGIAHGVKLSTNLDRIGDAAVALMIPYAAGKHLQHLKAYRGCTRLVVDVDRGELKLSGGLLYSPAGLERPSQDAYLTRPAVYRKVRLRLRPDRLERVSSSLRCNEAGLIDTRGSDTKLFTGATRTLFHADTTG